MKKLLLLTVLTAFMQGMANAQLTPVADTLSPRLAWQHPLSATVTAGLLVAGTSTLFVEPSLVANHLVREEVQLWRRNHFGFSGFEVEDYFQFFTLASVEGLDLLGVPSRHTGWPLLYRTGGSFFIVTVAVQSLKHGVNHWRPDHSATNSFPSGHTAMAAAGAELLRLEYGATSAWIPVAGFTVTAATALMRIYNDRHWLGDVLAGAAIGILSADISYWLNGKLETLFANVKKAPLANSHLSTLTYQLSTP